jgi:hypothetical protein
MLYNSGRKPSNGPLTQFTRQLDTALRGSHTKTIYDSLNREDASTLAQLRTGHVRLNGYFYRIGQRESNICQVRPR